MWLSDKMMIDRGAPLPQEDEDKPEKADEEQKPLIAQPEDKKEEE